MIGVPTGVNEWLDRVADFIEANQKPLLLLGGLIVVSRMFKLKVNLGKG